MPTCILEWSICIQKFSIYFFFLFFWAPRGCWIGLNWCGEIQDNLSCTQVLRKKIYVSHPSKEPGLVLKLEHNIKIFKKFKNSFYICSDFVLKGDRAYLYTNETIQRTSATNSVTSKLYFRRYPHYYEAKNLLI